MEKADVWQWVMDEQISLFGVGTIGIDSSDQASPEFIGELIEFDQSSGYEDACGSAMMILRWMTILTFMVQLFVTTAMMILQEGHSARHQYQSHRIKKVSFKRLWDGYVNTAEVTLYRFHTE